MPSERDVMEKVRRISQQSVAPAAAGYDRSGSFPETSVKALGAEGVLGLTVPADLGGLGLGPAEFVEATEEIAAACASTAMIFVMHVCGTEVIKQSSHPRRVEVLGEIARGNHLTTLAFSERGSRSHFWAPVSQARRVDGAHELNCEKSWVTSAGHSASYIVSTRAAGADGPTESTIYYVEGGHPGLAVSGAWDGLGMRANASAPMRLEGCRVGADALLSPEGGGLGVMLGMVLPWFQLGSSAAYNGISRAALDAAAQHLTSARFEHLGETLGSLPTSRARLARARVALDASRSLVSDAARSVAAADPNATLKILEVKACACETALDVTDAAMRLCGGAAFSKLLPIERHFRDARAGAVMAPTTEVLYDFIGKALLGQPLF